MGLRTFIVGGAIEAAAARLATRLELSVERGASVADAVARIDGTEPAIVMLPVSDVESELPEIATLVARGAQVVALATDTSAALRVAAFSAGVSDVLFAPFAPWFVEEVVLALAGNPLRKDARVPTQIEALLVPLGGVALAGNLVSLSMGELRARVSGSLPPGAILRVALKPPLPHRIPVLFARARRAEPLEDGRLEVHARFVGVTAEELALLGAYLEQQPTEVEDVAAVLAAIDSLDAQVLRDSGSTIAGLASPKLTGPESVWLRAAPGTADAALAGVAVARCRAELTASLMDAVGADLITLAGLPIARYLDDVRQAKRSVSAALELFARGEKPLLAELTSLSARLDESAATLESLSRQIAQQESPVVSLPLAPASPSAPPRTAVRPAAHSGEEDLALELDDQEPVEPFPEVAEATRVSARQLPKTDPTLVAAGTAKTDPHIPAFASSGVLPQDPDAYAKTNPQIQPLESDETVRTKPEMINPDSPRPIPPPPTVLPTPPGVAVSRTGRRLRNPFLEE